MVAVSNSNTIIVFFLIVVGIQRSNGYKELSQCLPHISSCFCCHCIIIIVVVIHVASRHPTHDPAPDECRGIPYKLRWQVLWAILPPAWCCPQEPWCAGSMCLGSTIRSESLSSDSPSLTIMMWDPPQLEPATAPLLPASPPPIKSRIGKTAFQEMVKSLRFQAPHTFCELWYIKQIKLPPKVFFFSSVRWGQYNSIIAPSPGCIRVEWEHVEWHLVHGRPW